MLSAGWHGSRMDGWLAKGGPGCPNRFEGTIGCPVGIIPLRKFSSGMEARSNGLIIAFEPTRIWLLSCLMKTHSFVEPLSLAAHFTFGHQMTVPKGLAIPKLNNQNCQFAEHFRISSHYPPLQLESSSLVVVVWDRRNFRIESVQPEPLAGTP